MYYIYMLRCVDNSIYTGIAKDVKRRLNEHFTKDKKCAKYTLNHIADEVICIYSTENRSLASKLEYHIKKLKKLDKEDIVKNNSLEKYLSEKVNVSCYNREYIMEKSIKNTNKYNITLKS